MKRINKIILALGLVVLGGIAFAGAASVRAEGKNTIEEGVYIGSLNVGGMTEDEAKEALNTFVSGLKDTSFTLKVTKRLLVISESAPIPISKRLDNPAPITSNVR